MRMALWQAVAETAKASRIIIVQFVSLTTPIHFLLVAIKWIKSCHCIKAMLSSITHSHSCYIFSQHHTFSSLMSLSLSVFPISRPFIRPQQ